MIDSAYQQFNALLNALRAALETQKGRARENEEIKVAGYRLMLNEDMEDGGLWLAEFLVVANTVDDVATIEFIARQVSAIIETVAKVGLLMSIRSITALDDAVATKRKSIAIEIETLWQS